MHHHAIVVDEALAGVAVRDILRRKLKMSRSLYRKVWAASGVTVDGQAVEPFARLAVGQTLMVAMATGTRVEPEAMDLAVVFEDEDVVVVDKPAGLVVHPTKGFAAGTLAGGLAHRYGAFHLINRLDQFTSGVLVIARHPWAAQRLTAALSRKLLRRTYLAIVQGRPAVQEGRIDAPIGRVPGAGRRAVDPAGQEALTHYRVLGDLTVGGAAAALISLSLETGRNHQIRVHMAYLGHPVLGDDRYGPEAPTWPRLCLHSSQVVFPHPATGATIAVTVPWPSDLPPIPIGLA
jgi:23S rRNA pseudouridine1911/1915/1917 synthase